MTDTKFSKSFHFNVLRFNKYHFTDHSTTPCPMHYFGCILKGTAEIKSKREKLILQPNEIFYIPKGLKYQSQWFSQDNGQIEFYSFGFEYSPINKPFILQKLVCSDTSRQLFDELCKEIPITNKSYGKLYSFFGVVSYDMKQDKYIAPNPIVEKATQYMTENFNSKISDVANHCGMSESGIYSLFKRELNKTPNDVRLEIMCDKAISLLSTTNISVQEISDSLGFSSTSYFRKILRNHTGKTPLEIRKESVF